MTNNINLKSLVAIAMFLLPSIVSAQGSSTNDANKKATFLPQVIEHVTNLTEAQRTAIEEALAEANEAQKRNNKAAGLTNEMVRNRKEIYENLKSELKGKELADRADADAGYNEAQIAARKKTGEIYRLYRFKMMKTFTAEQREMLPAWLKGDYAKSLEKEAAESDENAVK